MALAYTIKDQHAMHFITFTVHEWVDVFTRSIYCDILIDSLKFCQKNKGLEIYAWVIMSNHVHLIVRTLEYKLSDVIRDLKKFTSKKIVDAIDKNNQESRRDWMLWMFTLNGYVNFWREGYHGEEIYSDRFFILNKNIST